MGKPGGSNVPSSVNESIVHEKGTRGTETSKYPEEKKTTSDFVSSGERKRRSPNHPTTVGWGCGSAERTRKSRRRVLERTSKEGKRPVSERLNRQADTRVPQDTRNPVGSRRDHPPRLNTIQ